MTVPCCRDADPVAGTGSPSPLPPSAVVGPPRRRRTVSDQAGISSINRNQSVTRTFYLGLALKAYLKHCLHKRSNGDLSYRSESSTISLVVVDTISVYTISVYTISVYTISVYTISVHVNNLSEHNSVYTMLAHLPDKLTFKEKHPEKSEIYGFLARTSGN